MQFLVVFSFIALPIYVYIVEAVGKSKTIPTSLNHDKEIVKRSDGIMQELVNLLVNEKFHRRETKKMINGMVRQNAKILKQFAGFSKKLKYFERKVLKKASKLETIAEISSELKVLKKEFSMEQEKTKTKINKIQKNMRVSNTMKALDVINKTTRKLSKQLESEVNTINNKMIKLNKSVGFANMEQEIAKKKINKLQQNIRDFVDTKALQALNETTSLLSRQLESEVNKFNYKIIKLKRSLDIKNGAVYIRWGRTRCPSRDTKLVYSGYAAGAYFKHHAGTDTQCLPKNPNWRKYHDASNVAAHIYGAEYELYSYSVGEALHKTFQGYEVPCAVCQSKKRFNVHMIPAKDRCYNGWHLEYRGYLMTQHSNQAASNYACIDAKPEKIGSKTSHYGRLFYPVESICGLLPCPPYVNYRELTCAVCTF